MKRELTWQSVVSAVIVAALVSASYPYIILKLGLGPNVSVVSAFLGAVCLLVLAPGTHGQNRLLNNIVQTAGTSASMTAFMCVIAAAVDFAAQNPTVGGQLNGITHIDPWPMFGWLSCAGGIGVLFTALFRRHFIEDPKLVFGDGVAAAETIVVLDSRGPEATGKLAALGLTALASAVLDWFREGVGQLSEFFPNRRLESFHIGIEWNLLSVGIGLLISVNVSLSMLAGTLIVAGTGTHLLDAGIGREIVLKNVAPEHRAECERLIDKQWADLTPEEQTFVQSHGGKQAAYMKEQYFPILLLWYMWPATAVMVTSALTAVLLKWRSLVDTFAQLRVRGREEGREDVSLGTVVGGSLLLTVALAVLQHENFGMSYVQSAVAVLCSLPLILVGVRVLGETNFGPISVMTNALQAIFAVFWPASIGHNLIAAGMAGTCNAQGEGTTQDYKTGQILGSTPRVLTWVQLAAVPIGAAAVAVMYPLLVHRYHIGGSELPAPTGIKIANMAVLLSHGVEAFPQGALAWTVIAAVAGVLVVLAKHFAGIDWLPSATGVGLGLLLPGTLIVPVALGGAFGWLWRKLSPGSYERYAVTVASGFIAGEALLGGLVLPALSWFRPS